MASVWEFQKFTKKRVKGGPICWGCLPCDSARPFSNIECSAESWTKKNITHNFHSSQFFLWLTLRIPKTRFLDAWKFTKNFCAQIALAVFFGGFETTPHSQIRYLVPIKDSRYTHTYIHTHILFSQKWKCVKMTWTPLSQRLPFEFWCRYNNDLKINEHWLQRTLWPIDSTQQKMKK